MTDFTNPHFAEPAWLSLAMVGEVSRSARICLATLHSTFSPAGVRHSLRCAYRMTGVKFHHLGVAPPNFIRPYEQADIAFASLNCKGS